MDTRIGGSGSADEKARRVRSRGLDALVQYAAADEDLLALLWKDPESAVAELGVELSEFEWRIVRAAVGSGEREAAKQK